MTMRVQIQCINKRDRLNRHERIERVGGKNPNGTPWSLSEEEAIQGILAGKWQFYVSVNGNTVDVEIANHLGHRYLKTKADSTKVDNLLSLPECPR